MSEQSEMPDTAAYWRGRAEMAEAQVMTGKPVPTAVADLIHERDELAAENERLRAHVPEIDPDKRTTPLGCAAHDEWVRWPCSEWDRAGSADD